MKRPSYQSAIEWIAYNDEAGSADAMRPELVAELVTSCLVADIFDVAAARVGRDVVLHRINTDKWAKGLA